MSQGGELFSNYGLLSNEKLLYAYGFAVQNNSHDAIAVKLKAGRKDSSGSSGGAEEVVNMGVFYIESGGINGVPAVRLLWTH